MLTRSSASWIAIASLACVAHGLQAKFFYSPVLDHCQQNGQFFESDNLTAHGGVCAWVPGTSRLYSCPAPDPKCWTYSQTCGKGSQPSSDQIQCTSGSDSWCCTSDETCTLDPNQVNVCISNFLSPDSGKDLAAAVSTLKAAVNLTAITQTTPEPADPTYFSTKSFYLTDSATTTSATATASSSSGTRATPTSTSASSNNDGGGFVGDSPSLGTGAIVGITIVAVLGVIIIIASIFYFRLRRKRSMQANGSPERLELPPTSPATQGLTEYYGNTSKQPQGNISSSTGSVGTTKQWQAPMQEMSGVSTVRHELIGSQSARAELPS